MLRNALDGPVFRCGDEAWHSGAEHEESGFIGRGFFPPWKETSFPGPAPDRGMLHPRRDPKNSNATRTARTG